MRLDLELPGFRVFAPVPECGADLDTGRESLHAAWWMSAAPGTANVPVILSINFAGTG
jgi:ABC-type dipeptide/oligopeptide/nickel transport system permease subunit